MTVKSVIPRAKALEDVEAAIDHYAGEAGADIALAFIDALEEAYHCIATAPAAGSPRWAQELNLPGLRAVRLQRFPWLVFYLDLGEHVDVWRVLHARRDIPARMAEPENGSSALDDPISPSDHPKTGR